MRSTGVQPLSTRDTKQPHSSGEWTWIVLTAGICAHFVLTYNINNRPFLNLRRYADGQESSPFQERALMAWLFRAFAGRISMARYAAHLPAQLDNPYAILQLAIGFLSLLGAILFTRGSIGRLTGDRVFARWSALLVPFMAYFNLPLIYGPSATLPYDLPSLFFFSGCIFCILSNYTAAFYLLFILGSLNRETICFVTLFYGLWHVSGLTKASPGPVRWKAALNMLAQASAWVAIKLYLNHRYALNAHEGASGVFVPHLAYNLREVVKPQQWPLLLSNFGFTLPLLITQRKWIGEARIARACAVLLPLWLALMFYVGVIIEIRIYTELIALVSIAVALILFHRANTMVRIKPAPSCQ